MVDCILEYLTRLLHYSPAIIYDYVVATTTNTPSGLPDSKTVRLRFFSIVRILWPETQIKMCCSVPKVFTRSKKLLLAL